MLPPEILPVLSQYPSDCQPAQIESLGSAGGFSGAAFWRFQTARGRLGLRRWPAEHPSPERLAYIHAVLRHVAAAGFDVVPAPIATREGQGFVRHANRLWELTPWMPGRADFHEHPTTSRLEAAMTSLAEFHRAAETFREIAAAPVRHELRPSATVRRRLNQLQSLQQGGLREIAATVDANRWPALAQRAGRVLALFPQAADVVRRKLVHATPLAVASQPVMRDIWSDHVLFEGETVSGLVDFGALRADSVATDIARLLASLAHDDPALWRRGVEAYTRLRPLSREEMQLVEALDRSAALMSGVTWIDWVFRQGRRFDSPDALLVRVDLALERMERLPTANPLSECAM